MKQNEVKIGMYVRTPDGVGVVIEQMLRPYWKVNLNIGNESKNYHAFHLAQVEASKLIKRICIVCDKILEHAGPDGPDEFSNPPSDATVWTSVGNYGSTIFDMGEHTGERLKCYICDSCLTKKKDVVYSYQLHTERKVTQLKLFSEKED